MIPKIIHYCWFGGNEMPQEVREFIHTARKHMPEFEIKIWTDENFDLNSHPFIKVAYMEKKWAYVTDFVRLKVLEEYGGIYMDTDVEVRKSLKKFLTHKAFTGCENEYYCITATMGAVKEHPWIKRLLSYYNNPALIEGGKLQVRPNTAIITEITQSEWGWEPFDDYQVLKDDLHIYPSDVFCAKDIQTFKLNITDNTYTVHHFSGSWLSPITQIKLKIRKLFPVFLIKKYHKIRKKVMVKG
ncbi:glycosyltransferase family 32 protein [Streptococcus suis]